MKLRCVSPGTYAIHASDATNPTNRLALGYDATEDVGVISAVNSGTSWKNLSLNPNGGNVGIGLTVPDEKLVVFNGSTTGKYTATGWTHSSDKRLKHDINPLENSLEKILMLKGVEYKFNKDPENKTQIGFIAQDVEPLFPEVVETDNKGFKSMVYSNLIAPLVEAVKAIYKLLIGVESQQNLQNAKIKKLEAENTALKKYLCSKDPAAPICK
ncbi:MAG: tail fiber domain-containing protein [Bacteriovoracaceae bacterium]|nr:tail fiber domain-containing protein [Bacteriovoracaceae bacterium]